MGTVRSWLASLFVGSLLTLLFVVAGEANVGPLRAVITRMNSLVAMLPGPPVPPRPSASSAGSSSEGSSSERGDFVQLDFVSILRASNSARVQYSKNFPSCVRLLDENRRILHRSNFFCKKGDGVTVDLLLTQLPVKLGQQVMLCDKNDDTVCSSLVAVGDSVFACGNGVAEPQLGEECDRTPCTSGRACNAYCKCVSPSTADLSLTLTAPQKIDGTVSASITYTVTVFNAGPGTATNVVINDPAPRGLTFISGASDAACHLKEQTVICDGFDILSNQSKIITMTFTVPAKEACGSWIQNMANVSASSLDPNSNDNRRLVQTWVNCAALCSSGKLDPGEWCDDGNRKNTDGCSLSCIIEGGWVCTKVLGTRSICTPVCGDRVRKGNEQCEKDIPCSATYPGKACNEVTCQCVAPVCGDRQLVGDEQCEKGIPCSGTYAGKACNEAICQCVTAICRNGVLEQGEQCESGQLSLRCLAGQDCDLRSCQCVPRECSNGIITAGEQCDDENAESGDGCSYPFCRVEAGWRCVQTTPLLPSMCNKCGNKIKEGDEQCDGPGNPCPLGQTCTAACRCIGSSSSSRSSIIFSSSVSSSSSSRS